MKRSRGSGSSCSFLDFDMDKVVFKSVPSSPIKLAEVNPYNKTLLDVMEMV